MARILFGTLRSTVRAHRELALENLALRQQLAVWKARQPRPRLRAMDRIFWVVVSRLWKSWRDSLQVVRPETVVGWHRRGVRGYWGWKSPRRPFGSCSCLWCFSLDLRPRHGRSLPTGARTCDLHKR